MFFWKKKKENVAVKKDEEDELLHPTGEPDIEPPTESEPEISNDFKEHELEETSSEILDEIETIPTPEHTPISDAIDVEEEIKHDNDEKTGGWFSRLSEGLGKSSNKLTKGLTDLISKKKLDSKAKEQLEEALIMSDLGPATANKIVEKLAQNRFEKEISEEELKQALAKEIDDILEPVAGEIEIKKPENGPYVILVSGVNGVGKTTTIGKFGHYLQHDKKLSVMFAAGDTFRAAATEQLEIWAKRNHCKCYTKEVGADAAALAYEAYEQAKAENIDILLIDTAGRLQNKTNLMEELKKIVKVLKKHDENLPHQSLLVLDATTGQNAYSQVETFKEMVDISGLIVTKLDGSAKGGVVVGLADKFALPIYAVGVGEQIEDLQPFHPKEFANALVGIET